MNLEKATHSKILSYGERLKFLKVEETRLNAAIGKTFELHRTEGLDQSGMDLVRQELSRLSNEKKAVALEIQESETFIDSQPAPREIRRRIENGMVEFQLLWKKSIGSQKKRLLATLFETIFLWADECGVVFNGANASGENAQTPETKKALEDHSKAQNSKIVSLSDHRTRSSSGPFRGQSVENACVVKVGRGDAKVVEHPDAIKAYLVRQEKAKIDLTELAKLRFIENVKTPALCQIFKRGRSTIRQGIRTLRKCGVSGLNLTENEKNLIKVRILKENESYQRERI